ncbi:hypothetical protein IT157_05775 [bacterium]|nr:hypothetical protein [bacterium]
MLSEAIERFISKLHKLDQARQHVPEGEEHLPAAKYFREVVLPVMQELRIAGDELEVVCADEIWPFPKYRDLLHVS